MHANETYQLKVVLYADLTLTNHKFSWCMQGGPSHKVRGGVMLVRQDNGHQWRAESMQGEGRGLGNRRRAEGLKKRRPSVRKEAKGFNDSPKKRPRIRKGGPRA